MKSYLSTVSTRYLLILNHKFFYSLLRQLFLIAIFLIPFSMTWSHIHRASTNVIYADEWYFLTTVDQFFQNELAIGELWKQHNEHRYPLLRSIFILSAQWTDLNIQSLKYASLFFILLSTGLIYFYFRNHCYSEEMHRKFLYLFTPVPFLMFSLRQWENLLSGMQIVVFIMIMLVILSILFMKKGLETDQLNRSFLLSILCSIGTTFSFGIGVLIWFAVSFQIIISGQGHKRKLAVYLLCAVTVLAIYFYQLQRADNIHYVLTHLQQAFVYVLVNTGSGLVGEISNDDKAVLILDFIVGLILCLLYLITFFLHFKSTESVKRINSVFITFMFFGLLASLAMMYGRLHLGIEQATSSRYSTITLLGIVGLYLFLTHYFLENHLVVKNLKIILLTLIVMGWTSTTYAEYHMSTPRKQYMQCLEAILLAPDTASDDELTLFNSWSTPTVRQGVTILKKYQLNVYKPGDHQDGWDEVEMKKNKCAMCAPHSVQCP